MTKLPVLFQRDQCNETLLVVPKNRANLDRLKTLANKTKFVIGFYNDLIIVEQGPGGWEKVSKKAKSFVPQGFHVPDQAALVQGPETVEYVCNHCPREHRECGGPLAQMPEYRSRTQPRSGMDALRQAVVRKYDCPLYDQNIEDVDGGIQQKDLRVLGWDPVDSPKAFVEGELDEDHYLTLKELVDKGVDLGDIKQVREQASSADVETWLHAADYPQSRGWRRTSSAMTLNDMIFDPQIVGANRMAAKVRGAHAKAKKKEISDYRENNCQRCIFDCEKTPWNKDNPRPLTEERIMDEFRPDKDDLAWMAMFTIMNWKDEFRSEESGRLRMAISRRPTRLESGDWGVQIAACATGYETIARMTVEDYIQHLKSRNSYAPEPPSISVDDERHLAFTNWALKSIDRLTSGNCARFYGNGRCQYNQILFIDMRRDCSYIEIGSDTLATSYGGMGWRGSHISPKDRPRFRTGYSFPFAESIWDWFYSAPNACGGSKK